VVVFEEPTPHQLISALQPDILAKGDDWPENAIVGRDVVEARGGVVVRITIEPGYSTTRLIERIRRSPD
jgi:D-beta-D-heptose 7-phosphate kinase/D-beta-D-heptose 1-phosphate adenosyltransferase